MFTFILLVFMLALFAVTAIIAIGAGGAAFIVVFADVIVFGVIVALIIRYLVKKFKK